MKPPRPEREACAREDQHTRRGHLGMFSVSAGLRTSPKLFVIVHSRRFLVDLCPARRVGTPMCSEGEEKKTFH
jgi:hypothetical protein